MFYRVENNFLGNDVLLEPTDCFEKTDELGNVCYIQDEKNFDITIQTSDIKEICFSKYILGAFFGKRQFLKEDHLYYIYATEAIPDKDLSDNNIFDFATTKEVRYLNSINAKLIGSVEIDGFFIHNISRIEESICFDSTTYQYNNDEGLELMKEMEGFLQYINWINL